jgi:RNA polymerase sigma-70 factor (ECF subfamily)
LEESFTGDCLNERVNENAIALEGDDDSPDEELVRLVLAGDTEHFERIYRRFYSRAYRMAYGMVGTRAGAEDLAQEIFMRVYQRLGEYRGEASFATWFYRLAVNQSINYLRKQRSGIKQDQAEDVAQLTLPAESNRIEDGVLQRQLQLQVDKALQSLKPKLRMVVVLRDIEGLNYQEIAERTNCSMGTVASRLNRARKILASKLEHLKGAY